MIRSEQTNEIATALAKARAGFASILKSRQAEIKSEKGRYGYRYENLADVLEAVTLPLAEQGIVVAQTVIPTDAGRLEVQSTLLHSSGQWIAGRLPLPVAPNARPQDFGSALTYMRRYCLEALLGLAAEDDDGEQAQRAPRPAPTPPPQQRAQGAPPVRPAAASAPMREPGDESEDPSTRASEPIDRDLLSTMRARLDAAQRAADVVALMKDAEARLDPSLYPAFRQEAATRYSALKAS